MGGPARVGLLGRRSWPDCVFPSLQSNKVPVVQHPHHVHPLTPLITYSNEHFTPGNPPPHLPADVDPKTGRTRAWVQRRRVSRDHSTGPLDMPFPPPGILFPLLLNLQISSQSTSQQRSFSNENKSLYTGSKSTRDLYSICHNAVLFIFKFTSSSPLD